MTIPYSKKYIQETFKQFEEEVAGKFTTDDNEKELKNIIDGAFGDKDMLDMYA